MISETRREHLRRIHRPADDTCAVQHEGYPCDAIQLLDELEAVEKEARVAFEEYVQNAAIELTALKRRVTISESKIRRAIADLS